MSDEDFTEADEAQMAAEYDRARGYDQPREDRLLLVTLSPADRALLEMAARRNVNYLADYTAEDDE